MGSELARDGEVLWGLRPEVLFQELLSGSILRSLAVSEDRREGKDDGIRATGLLRMPAVLPGLASIDPYGDLVRTVRSFAAHPDAVLEFPYDWRLSIAHTAELLARAAWEDLTRWRRHTKGSREARLSLICHSMGGLVARYFAEVLGGRGEVRHLITLGTPFAGSVKAVRMLATGRLLPLGALASRLGALARTLPGVYELLPRYPCVQEAKALRALEPADLVALGGDGDLVAAAEEVHARLTGALTSGQPFGVRPVLGTTQPTLCSLSIDAGEARFSDTAPGEQWGGDGTVLLGAAYTAGSAPAFLPQRHGMIARSDEAIANVRSILTQHLLEERGLGPPLGAGVGLELPDAAVAGEPFVVGAVTTSPLQPWCRFVDADTGAQVALAHLCPDEPRASVTLSLPGIYSVELHGVGFSPWRSFCSSHPRQRDLPLVPRPRSWSRRRDRFRRSLGGLFLLSDFTGVGAEASTSLTMGTRWTPVGRETPRGCDVPAKVSGSHNPGCGRGPFLGEDAQARESLAGEGSSDMTPGSRDVAGVVDDVLALGECGHESLERKVC